MTWDNCKKCMFIPRSTYTSALFKVLLTLKILHGGRTGSRGSTLEDIAMHMIKYFCLDGDIKSQVLSTLKYGVKLHFILRRKDKFSLISPASAIQLAPCKFKNEEIERIACIYPAKWHSNMCAGNVCGAQQNTSCCGKRRKRQSSTCCHAEEAEESGPADPCALCMAKRSKTVSQQSLCSECGSQKKRRHAPCPQELPSICAQKRQKRNSFQSSSFDDPCQMCGDEDEEEEEACECRSRRPKTRRSCAKYVVPPSPCFQTKQRSMSRISSKRPRKSKPRCPKPRPPICARKRSRKESSVPSSSSSGWDDLCQYCPKEDSDSDQNQQDAYKNCECCGQ